LGASEKAEGAAEGGRAARRSRVAAWNPWIVLVAAILLAYHNSFAGKLAFDDHAYLGTDKFARLESLAAASNRPFLFWTFVANHRWGGSNAFGYHAVNLGIHVGAALALALLVRRVTARDHAGSPWLAIATALVWGVHPLTTQAVTYLIQRGESLASMFYLLGLLAVSLVAGRAESDVRSFTRVRATMMGLFAILCAWLGMLSKEIAATLPLAALALDRVRYASTWSELLRRRGWLHFGMATPWLWFTPWLANYLMGHVARPNADGALAGVGWTPWQYFSNQPAVILHYLRLAVWPDRLCLDYAWQPATRFIDVAPAFAIVLCAGVVAAIGLVRRRLWGLAAAGFFLVLAPSSSFLPIADLAFEHRLYLPLAFVVALAVYGGYALVERLAGRLRVPQFAGPWFAIVVVCVATGLAARTVSRNRDYAEPARLWRGAIEINPRNYRAHSNLGCVLYEQGDARGAAEAFAASVRLYRDDGHAWAGLAASLSRLGDHKTALDCFRKAIVLLPESSVAHNDMGACLDQMGDRQAAEQSFRRALELDPRFAVAAHNLGDLLLRRDADVEALRWLEVAVQCDSNLAAARRKLAWLLATTADDRLRDPARAADLLRPWIARWSRSPRASAGVPDGESIAAPAEAESTTDWSASVPDSAAARWLDTAAAMEAARGEFATAVRMLDEALAANGANDEKSQQHQSELRARRALYEDRRPYRRTPHLRSPVDGSTRTGS
jgi:tetratricopeptide (TPR) repeat protein